MVYPLGDKADPIAALALLPSGLQSTISSVP